MDTLMINWTQKAYDYVWDRWGVPLGWILQLFVVTLFGCSVYRESEMLPLILVITGLLLLTGRYYIQLQNAGRYTEVNLRALASRTRWQIRCAFLLFFWALTITFTVKFWAQWSSGMIAVSLLDQMCWTGWWYGLTVMLRERDDARFKRFRPQFNPI